MLPVLCRAVVQSFRDEELAEAVASLFNTVRTYRSDLMQHVLQAQASLQQPH